MKQRLLVMNGQKIVQHEQEGRWLNDKVEKAGLVKPGIYNLYCYVLPWLRSKGSKYPAHGREEERSTA
jgi:hypothetical protein